jgi:hypothetical protein
MPGEEELTWMDRMVRIKVIADFNSLILILYILSTHV